MGRVLWEKRDGIIVVFHGACVCAGLLRHFTRDRCDIEKLTRVLFFSFLTFFQNETSVYLSF